MLADRKMNDDLFFKQLAADFAAATRAAAEPAAGRQMGADSVCLRDEDSFGQEQLRSSLVRRLANRQLSVQDCLTRLEESLSGEVRPREAGRIVHALGLLDGQFNRGPLSHFCAVQAVALAEAAGVPRQQDAFLLHFCDRQTVRSLRASVQTLRKNGQLTCSEARAYERWIGLSDHATRCSNFADSSQHGALSRIYPWVGAAAVVAAGCSVFFAVLALAAVLPATVPASCVALVALVAAGVVGFMTVSVCAQGVAWGLWRWTALGYSGAWQ